MPWNVSSFEAEAALAERKAFEALSQATPKTFKGKLDTGKKVSEKRKELSTGPQGQRLS
jgi:hypothetical protein